MSEPSHGHHPRASHEEQDIDLGAVLWSGVGLLAVSAVVYVVVWLMFGLLAGREARRANPKYPLAAAESTRLPPEPRLQTVPREDLQNLRTREDALLNGYTWVDRNAGTVRIPVSEAMRLTLERGLPSRPTEEAKK